MSTYEDRNTPLRRDPWPSPIEAWMDPPWLMSGRSMTAWFAVPWMMVEASLSPDLRRSTMESVRIRLRFYDLAYTALSADRPGVIAPRTGRFREAVFGVPARFGEIDGEVSVYMWADSTDYTAWGREVFGWPVLPGSIQLDGGFWSGDSAIGATATAVMKSGSGSVSLVDVAVKSEASRGTPAGTWLTPRRRVQRSGLSSDERSVLIVRPEVRRPGRCFSGTCRVIIDLAEPHPFASLGAFNAELEAADGFEIVVGGDVDES